jgi:hypothetical protein
MEGSMTKVGPMENKWPHGKMPCVIILGKCRLIPVFTSAYGHCTTRKASLQLCETRTIQ